MNTEQLLDKTHELIAIESTADNPAGLRSAYDLMVDFVRGHKHGPTITIEEFQRHGKPSFLAYKGPTRPKQFHLLLNGHVDVVPGKPEQFKPVIRDGKLFGRGATDMKAASIVMADVFCEFVHRVPFESGLQIVTDEESTGKDGTLYQIERGVRSDFVICGECGREPNTYEIANCCKGVFVVEVGFHGESAHGAYPWRGDNAAERLNQFVNALRERYPLPDKATDDSTIAITGIHAPSDAHTTTPAYGTVRLNGRFVKGDPLLSDMKKFTRFLKLLDPRAEIVSVYDFSDGFYTNKNNPQYLQLKASAERVEGHGFKDVQRHGASDARFYTLVGNQACEFGIAGEHQHGADENITLQAFRDYHQTLRTFYASGV